MRFFKVVKPNYGLEVGDNIVFSEYYRKVPRISDGANKTKYVYISNFNRLDLILNEYVVPMSESEVRKLIPHLPKMCLEFDNVPF